MSRYTTQLRWVVEQALDDIGAPHEESMWERVYSEVGLADYPIFEEAHRKVLNDKIIRHYYTREIGAETVARWRMFVRDAMHLIMPYYNQLYESELLALGMEPLGDRNLSHTEHAWGTAENMGSGTTESSTDTQNVYQDTPSSQMIPDQVKSLEYATNATFDTETASGKASNESTGSYDTMVQRNETGYSRPQSELLKLYRETFLNIDNDVVHDRELAQCFMTIW
jgi:hypothetical protein